MSHAGFGNYKFNAPEIPRPYLDPYGIRTRPYYAVEFYGSIKVCLISRVLDFTMACLEPITYNEWSREAVKCMGGSFTPNDCKSEETGLIQPRIEGHFSFRTFWTKFCNILKYGMNLKFEPIVQFFLEIL